MLIKILLNYPNKQLVKELYEGLEQCGYSDVRPAHSQVLQYLTKEGLRITELSEKAQMTKQSMSVLVYDMEKAGYLKRSNDKTDKRAIIFKPTAKGDKVVLAARKLIRQIIQGWEVKLGKKKMNTLIALLTELNEKIK